MSKAFVLMTAMPPTVGHAHLIEFAAALADEVTVIVCTQEHEPFAAERFTSLREFADKNFDRYTVFVRRLHRNLMQDPATPGFWEMWDGIMTEYGFMPGDLVVSSEPYGQTLADRLNGTFMPYDPERQLYYTKATKIREEPGKYFNDILPEFQRYLTSTITFFGAESTGKSTLSEEMSRVLNGHWLFEYARPYLETVYKDVPYMERITTDSMTAIWKGQAATQRHAKGWTGKPFIIQDTDLFSTVGYWQHGDWPKFLGPVPNDMIKEAQELKSDLYIITPSNIAFEHDSIRNQDDQREQSDQYWIDLAEREGLNYIVLDSDNWFERMSQARAAIEAVWKEKADKLFYDRKGL